MRIVRVTQPLDYFINPSLVDWKLRVGKAEAGKISRAAMKVGTRVDELIKTGEAPIVKDKPEVHSAHRAFKKWVEVYKPESIVVQTRSNRECEGVELSGEPDIMALDTLIDIKCAGRISLSYWLQLAAYAWLKDWTGNIAVLRLDKKTESFEYVVKPFDEKLLSVYMGVLRAFVYYTEGEDESDVEL